MKDKMQGTKDEIEGKGKEVIGKLGGERANPVANLRLFDSREEDVGKPPLADPVACANGFGNPAEPGVQPCERIIDGSVNAPLLVR
jgi:hypothetical protein